MKKHSENTEPSNSTKPVLPAVFPKDKNGKQVKVGDKVQGFGCITFQDGFKIDRTPIVTANIQNGRLYFGNLSCESFTTGFVILK